MYESKENDYLKTMKPILFIAKILCVLPIWIKSRNIIPPVISSKIVSSIAVAACLLFHKHNLYYLFEIITDENNRNATFLAGKLGPEVMQGFFCTAVPLLMWNRNEEIQEYWKKWEVFQSNYENITEKPYVSRKRKFIKIAAVLLVSWLTMLTVYGAVFYVHIFYDVFDFIVYIHYYALIYLTPTYWLTNCAYFWSMSEDIHMLGKKIIAEKKETRKLNKLISLWVNLNDLTNDFIEVHSYIFASFLMMIFVCIVTYSYVLLNYSTFQRIYPLAFYSIMWIACVIFLLIFCETAHLVFYKIKRQQKEVLLQENMAEIKIEMLQPVVRFVQTVWIQNSGMNFHGFFILNRITFTVIVSLGINYLIVLRQFSEN